MTDLPDYTIGTNIIAQSLASLSVDIIAQSLANLHVDIAAQTLANLNIDIIAQTIGNLDIDVAAQGLAELTQRPKFGAGALIKDDVTVSQTDEFTLVTVSGKGVTYGGYIYCTDDTAYRGDIPRMYVDTFQIHDHNFFIMNEHSMGPLGPTALFLLAYNPTEPKFTVGVAKGITFESSISLRWKSYDANPRTIYYSLLHALI